MKMRWIKEEVKKTASMHRDLIPAGNPWGDVTNDGFNEDWSEQVDLTVEEEEELSVIPTPSNEQLLKYAAENPPPQEWFDEEPMTPPND